MRAPQMQLHKTARPGRPQSQEVGNENSSVRAYYTLKMLGLFVLYTAGGLVGLLFAAFLVLTVYIYYIHWKYSHIPSPKLPRYVRSVIFIL